MLELWNSRAASTLRPMDCIEGTMYSPSASLIAAYVILVCTAYEKSTYPTEYGVFLTIPASSAGPVTAMLSFAHVKLRELRYWLSNIRELLVLFSMSLSCTTIILSSGRLRLGFKSLITASFHRVIVPFNMRNNVVELSLRPDGISGKAGILYTM